MTALYDAIAEANVQEKLKTFVSAFLDARDDIVRLVNRLMHWDGAGKYTKIMTGAFNLSCRIEHSITGDAVLVRFPIPGRIHERWVEEKLANELAFMEYIVENTSIPIPRVIHRGSAGESPENLGPFVIMEFANGVDLDTVLWRKTDTNSQDAVLNPNIDNKKLDFIYDQIAGFQLQLVRLKLPRIGAVSREPVSGKWVVSKRPLTYNMNDIVTGAGYPIDQTPQAPFDTSYDYFTTLGNTHLTQLWTHRNLAYNEQEARNQFISRHRFVDMIAESCVKGDNTGPFLPFCDDMGPSNMLVDKNTLRITAVLDFEFTNALPAQYSYDPPWWLLLKAPHRWFADGETQQFFNLFPPRVAQFIRAMERAEAMLPSTEAVAELPLSARMLESWKTGRFWFNYMSRKGFDLDTVYWNAVHVDGASEDALGVETRTQMEPFVRMKMKQLEEYYKDEDNDDRIPKLTIS